MHSEQPTTKYFQRDCVCAMIICKCKCLCYYHMQIFSWVSVLHWWILGTCSKQWIGREIPWLHLFLFCTKPSNAAEMSSVDGVSITPQLSCADGGIQLMDIFIRQIIISCPYSSFWKVSFSFLLVFLCHLLTPGLLTSSIIMCALPVPFSSLFFSLPPSISHCLFRAFLNFILLSVLLAMEGR